MAFQYNPTSSQSYSDQLLASLAPAQQPVGSWAQGGSNIASDYVKALLQQKMNPNSGLNLPNPFNGVRNGISALFTPAPTSSSTAIY